MSINKDFNEKINESQEEIPKEQTTSQKITNIKQNVNNSLNNNISDCPINPPNDINSIKILNADIFTKNNNDNIIQTQNINNIKQYDEIPNMASVDLVKNIYCMWDLDNIFTVFKMKKGGLYLAYPLLQTLICYDLIDEVKVITIKDAHECYIINFRHIYDNNLNKDIIMTISGEDSNLKLWDVEKWECILNLQKVYKFGIMFSACFLYDGNSGNNYIVTSNCTGSEYIKVFDLNGNKIKDVPYHKDNNENNGNNINNDNDNSLDNDNNHDDYNNNNNDNNNGNNTYNNNENNNDSNTDNNINHDIDNYIDNNNIDYNENINNNIDNNDIIDTGNGDIVKEIDDDNIGYNNYNNIEKKEENIINNKTNIINDSNKNINEDHIENHIKIENVYNNKELKDDRINNNIENDINNENVNNNVINNKIDINIENNNNENIINNNNLNNNNLKDEKESNIILNDTNNEYEDNNNIKDNENLNNNYNEENNNISNDNNNIENDNMSNNEDNSTNNILIIEEEFNNVYFIETYYSKEKNFTYIIACCSENVKSYNFNLNILYHKYIDEERPKKIHSSATIKERENITHLIEAALDGYIRIWDFHQGILLKRIMVCEEGVKGICLWDDNYLCVGCDDKSIKFLEMNEEKITKILFGHKMKICCIKKINHHKYGKCLISKGWGGDFIKLWFNNEIE